MRRRRLARMVSAEDRARFERDGVVVKNDFAPPDLFPALVEEIEAFASSAREFKEGDAITRRIALTPENLKKLPACRRLLQMPEWKGLTRYVSSYDAEPTVFIQTIFSKADDQSRIDPQTRLHMDTFHPTMKAWLFLHEVEEADGPFTYSRGSHRRNPRREAWERRQALKACDKSSRKKGGAFRSTKTELRRMGYPKAEKFAVPANTFVVADTYGFHARGHQRAALGAGGDLGLFAPQPLRALDRAGPRLTAAAAPPPGGDRLVVHGSAPEARPRHPALAARRRHPAGRAAAALARAGPRIEPGRPTSDPDRAGVVNRPGAE